MSNGGGKRLIRAYVDIETTGLNRHQYELTVVGICVEQGRTREAIQRRAGTCPGEPGCQTQRLAPGRFD